LLLQRSRELAWCWTGHESVHGQSRAEDLLDQEPHAQDVERINAGFDERKVCEVGVATENFGPRAFNRSPDAAGNRGEGWSFIAKRWRCKVGGANVSNRFLDKHPAHGVAADLAARSARDLGNNKPALGNGLSTQSLKTPGLKALGAGARTVL
jgi:hypothetical protein